MEHRTSRRHAAMLSLFTSLSAVALQVQAATLVAYDFDAPDGSFTTDVDAIAPTLGATPWQDLDGTLTSFAGNPGRAIGARSFDNGNSLRFTLQAAAGERFVLESLSFGQQASASGPKSWAARINGQLVASASTTSGFTAIAIPLALAAGSLFEFSFDGFDASSGQGTWRIDNVVVTGSPAPVPVPAALPLFASGLLWLRARRRRATVS
jgi:uncharacterized protein (TIGR03382 family)